MSLRRSRILNYRNIVEFWFDFRTTDTLSPWLLWIISVYFAWSTINKQAGFQLPKSAFECFCSWNCPGLRSWRRDIYGEKEIEGELLDDFFQSSLYEKIKKKHLAYQEVLLFFSSKYPPKFLEEFFMLDANE